MPVKNSIDFRDINNQAWKNKHEELYFLENNKTETLPMFPNTQPDIYNPANKTDKSTDAEEWKPKTSRIVGDSMIAGLREAKLSRNRKVEVSFFSGAKLNAVHDYLVPLVTKKHRQTHIGTTDAAYKNEDDI